MDADLETSAAWRMTERCLACERAERWAPLLAADDRSRSTPLPDPRVRPFAPRGDRTPGIGFLRWLGAINRWGGTALIHPRATA